MKAYRLYLSQSIFLWCSICLVFSLVMPAGNQAHGQTIYALGDSITFGRVHQFDADDYPESAYRLNSGGPPANIRAYREHLHDLLVDSSCNADVDWVGAKDEPNRLPEYHEGRSGNRVDQFLSRTWSDDNGNDRQGIEGWLSQLRPDYVLIHIGTNDILQGQTAASTRNEIDELLDVVYFERPNAKIFLANVIPVFGWWANHRNAEPYPVENIGSRMQQLSGMINSLVANRAASGDDIHLVDVNSTFFVNERNVTNCATGAAGDPANMSTSACRTPPDGSPMEPDGVHPNLVGEKFIADRFFEVMSGNTNVCSMGGSTGGNTDDDDSGGNAGSGGGSLFQESESGSLSGNMQIVNNGSASGGQFVRVPAGIAGNSNRDFIEFEVNIETTGNYRVNARVRGPSGSQNSFFAQIDDGPRYLWDIPSNSQLTADRVSNRGSGDVTERLNAGVHTLRVSVRESGAQLDWIEFELVGGGSSGGAGDTGGDNGSGDTGGGNTGSGGGSLFQESESGSLSGNMQIVNNGSASGGQFVRVPAGIAGNSNRDFIEFEVNIETTGNYRVNARVRGPSGSQNSFFAQIDNGPRYLWDIPSNNQLTEDRVSNRGSGDVTERLNAGVHTLRVSVRESGAQLDWIEFELVDGGSSGGAGDIGGDNGSGDTGGGNTGSGGGSLFRESESGSLSGNMQIVNNGSASGGQFVRVPAGIAGNSNRDFIEFEVNIETTGNYRVNARVRGPSGSQNSFFAQIDDGPRYLWDIPSNNQLTEDRISNRGSGDVTERLNAGVHTLRVSVRESGAQLDWIEFERR